MQTTRSTTALLAVAALALAACGDDERPRLSDRELSEKLNPAVERISGEYGAVFATLGRARETATVPARVRARMRQVADVERETAEQVETLVPPARTEDAVRALAEGARRHATTLDRLAGDRRLTVARMADAFEHGETAAPLRRLVRAGIVEAPDSR